MRIIIQAKPGNELLALRAAKALLASEHKDCVYGYGDVHIWAKRTKSGVSAREY